ncbi:hypothetical protein [Corynebacterium sp. CNJ-954]|uniref:hypothetical protein n=1 Tax=Corynebacterium sp. CNJ-954 TaxID=1904962 RepID=UPI00111520E8|nr:hypothetical protein [Corynebacterium sp. CNJ-954]
MPVTVTQDEDMIRMYICNARAGAAVHVFPLVSAIWWYPACRVVSGHSPTYQDASAGLPADMNFYPVGQRERLRGFGTFKTKTLVNSREMISKKVSSDHEGPPVECRKCPGSRQDTNKQKVG